jgi:hypothetical protein
MNVPDSRRDLNSPKESNALIESQTKPGLRSDFNSPAHKVKDNSFIFNTSEKAKKNLESSDSGEATPGEENDS